MSTPARCESRSQIDDDVASGPRTAHENVTVGWLIERLCAAPETVPSSATAIKYWSCLRVKAMA